jgi:TubC N-terminal docking domain
MGGSVLSAANLIREAASASVWVALDGDKLALRAKAKPPDELIAKLKANKRYIIALLRQAACSVRPAGYTDAEWAGGSRQRGPAGLSATGARPVPSVKGLCLLAPSVRHGLVSRTGLAAPPIWPGGCYVYAAQMRGISRPIAFSEPC